VASDGQARVYDVDAAYPQFVWQIANDGLGVEQLANADRRELGNDAAGRGEHQRRGDLLTYWYTGGM